MIMSGIQGWLPLVPPAGYLLQSAVVLSLALIIIAACRKRSAALRHFVLASFLIGLLLLPVLTVLPVGFRTGLLPGSFPSDARRSASPQVKPGASEGPAGPNRIGAGVLASVEEGNPPPAPGSRIPGRGRGRWLGLMVTAGWSAGALLILLRLGLGLVRAYRLTREARPLGGASWRLLIDRFLARVELRRPVRLRSHDGVSVPLTWGLLRPVILMPDGTESWSEDERSTALFHELSHVKRLDFLVLLLVRLSLALYWLNPLSWAVFRALRREQEKACDELVLRAGIKPSTYAASLLRFRTRRGGRLSPSAALLGLFGRSRLNERLAAILKQKLIFKEVKMKTKLMLSAIVILAVGLVGMARPGYPSRDEAASPGPAALVEAGSQTAGSVQAHTSDPVIARDQEKESKDKKEKAEKSEKGPEAQSGVKKIIIEPAEGKEGRIEVRILEGDEARTVVVDKPIVIWTGSSGKKEKRVWVTVDGDKIVLSKDGGLSLKIRDGEWTVAESGRVRKLDKGGVYLCRVVEADSKPGALSIIIEKPGAEAGGISGLQMKWIPAEGGEHGIWVVENEKDIQARLQKIREQLKLVQEHKLDISEVDKSLAALEESLGKDERKMVVLPETKVRKIVGLGRSEGGENTVTIQVQDEAGLTIVIQASPGQISKDRYDRALELMKKQLPGGFSIEAELKEASGTIVVRVKGPKESRKEVQGLVDKLLKTLNEELKLDESKKK
jgi:beta-lactamase regulating signal transducer with metallopeptidase domain